MKKKVGIPRGMFYYDYYILWQSFFNNLGVEVVVSPKTNKDILNRGVHTCVDEACLPVKVFHGHVDYLKDKVDYIFIPKLISIYKKEYGCPKHLGLPDMIKHSIDDLPEIIDTEINLRKSDKNLKKAILYTGKYFTNNSKKILRAYNKANNKYEKYLSLLLSDLVSNNSMESYNGSTIISIDEKQDSKKKILLLGHSYVVYDEHINMNIENKLKQNKIKIITGEMIDEKTIRKHTSNLSKRMFWTQGQKVIGGAFASIEENTIDGIIYISSFGCGLDSVLMDLVGRKAEENKMPFMILTIDEQTGEAGINTRIEAFLDMLEWRDRDEDNISTYG